MTELGTTIEPSQGQVRSYFNKFVRFEFGLEGWQKIMAVFNYTEEGHPARRSPRRAQDMSPSLNAEKLWLAHGKHSAVVAMRTGLVMDLLGITGDLRADGLTAAVLHDITKPDEIQNRPAEGVTWDSYAAVSARGKKILEQHGINKRAVRLSGSMGHESLLETAAILKKPDLSEEELVYLTIHAMDDISSGDSWNQKGAFEARMKKNRINPQMSKLNEDAVAKFGENMTDYQEKVGLQVLNVLAKKLGVSAEDLPIYIDQKLKERMVMN